MAQHGPTGKHGADNKSADTASQETKKIETHKTSSDSSARTQKIDRASKADETKEMPRAKSDRAASKSSDDAADKTVKFHSADEKKTVKPISVGDDAKKPAKQVTSGAADADAAAAKKRNGIIAAAVIIVIIIAAIIAFMALNSNNVSEGPSNELEVVDVETEPVDNPINFAEWQARNPDVYGYMVVPNTNVDLPILFSAENDNYYLVHDIDGNSTIVGAIYSQSMNKQDFTDPVTVLYGHTLLNGTMFTELHKFEDPEFFAANPYFNVYLPTEMLTYEVVAAIEFDDRHIMNTMDLSQESVVQGLYDEFLHPTFEKAQVREDATLTAGQDSVLVLSTCTEPANDAKRFLVIGKLMTRQPTK